MTWLGKRLDVALVLRPAPLVTGENRIFTPTRRSLVYELVGWLIGQSVALVLLLLFVFGPAAIETVAWTRWLWPLERALQGSAWLEQLILSLVPDALHLLVSALSVIAFVTQLLLTLVGIWASHRYTWPESPKKWRSVGRHGSCCGSPGRWARARRASTRRMDNGGSSRPREEARGGCPATPRRSRPRAAQGTRHLLIRQALADQYARYQARN